MTCDNCKNNSGIYNLHNACCSARFLMQWPGDQSSTAQALCKRYGHDIDELRREAKRQREDQFQKAIRRPA